MNSEVITGFAIGWITDRRRWTHRAICRVTGGEYAHCFVIYFSSNEGTDSVYVECGAHLNESRNGSGLSAPRPLTSLKSWVHEHPKTITCCYMLLPLTKTELSQCWKSYNYYLPRVKYASAQLISNWFSCRTGILLSSRRTSEFRWSCSEAAARLCPASVQLDVLKLGTFRWDEYVPSGSQPASLLGLCMSSGFALTAL